jgi:hypothetical protein
MSGDASSYKKYVTGNNLEGAGEIVSYYQQVKNLPE